VNFAPINGLRILQVETSILIATFFLLLMVMRSARPWVARLRWPQWLLGKNWRSVCFVIALALFGRALLLPVIGVPEPRINDEYSYLLMADTFSHHRLTNPSPPAWQHFETFHVNLLPTYHSKYPVAQGAVLAFGEMVFNRPWIGVYLGTALMCGAICWALRAFVGPGWALLGGLLAVARFALLSYWMNSYWGGSVAALGGAVALGAVVRLFDPELSPRCRLALSATFAVGLVILATSRPYEGLAFALPLIAFFLYRLLSGGAAGSGVLPVLLPVLVIGAAAIAAMGYYNHATTGKAWQMPYALYNRTSWPLALFLGQGENPQAQLSDPVFVKYFKLIETEYEYEKSKSLSGILSLETKRLALNWFFYVGPALTIPVMIGFVSCMQRPRLRIAVLVFLSTAIALGLYIYSLPHYAAVATIAIYIFAAEGLRYLWDLGEKGERAFVIAVCLTVVVVSLTRQTGATVLSTKFRFPDQRKLIAQQLEPEPGKHLVIVSYDLERHYPGNELVHNGADFGSEKVLWARDKGDKNNLDLCGAFPDRTIWRVIADDEHVTLGQLDLCKQR
jgi:hypothetical protein